MVIRKLLILLGMAIVSLVIFMVGERIRRQRGETNEVSRKMVHMIHGTVISVIPFIFGYWLVYIIEALFLLSVSEAYKLKMFRWLWRVGRKSWGEYAYPLGVVTAAFFANSLWVFLASVLVLTFADSAAALIGKKYGRRGIYTVLDQKKSILGSLAFAVTAFSIVGAVAVFSPVQFTVTGWEVIAAVALMLTFVENLGVYGVDNFLIPVASVFLLNAL